MSLVAGQSGVIRADDLLQPGMPSKFVELIDGNLVTTLPPGRRYNRVAFNVEIAFRQFCEQHANLDFGGDNDGFLLSRDPDTLLSPDASLYRRRPEQEKTWLEFAPEIAVEVLSPSNLRPAVTFKRHRFFAAGTEQFWVVDPDTKTIEFYFKEGHRIVAQGDETVQGEGIASGLQIDFKEVFKAN